MSRLPGVGITEASATPSKTSPIGPSARTFAHTCPAMISSAITRVLQLLEAISGARVAEFELTCEAQLRWIRQNAEFSSEAEKQFHPLSVLGVEMIVDVLSEIRFDQLRRDR